MSNELVKKESVAMVVNGQWTPEQVELIKNMCAPKATPDEFKVFLHFCQSNGLDPLKKEVMFVKYKDGDPGQIFAGKNGKLVIAHRNPRYNGHSKGLVKIGEKVTGAWAEVYLKGIDHPVRVEVEMAEYNKGYSVWKTIPNTMIQKVALSQALTEAFPDQFGNVYEQGESWDEKQSQEIAKIEAIPVQAVVTPPEPQSTATEPANPVKQPSDDPTEVLEFMDEMQKILEINGQDPNDEKSFFDWSAKKHHTKATSFVDVPAGAFDVVRLTMSEYLKEKTGQYVNINGEVENASNADRD